MYANDGISHWVAYFATCLAFLAYLFWMLRRQRAAVRLA
jgi:cbb3-type cytochrome oxidase subunit 3